PPVAVGLAAFLVVRGRWAPGSRAPAAPLLRGRRGRAAAPAGTRGGRRRRAPATSVLLVRWFAPALFVLMAVLVPTVVAPVVVVLVALVDLVDLAPLFHDDRR